MENFMEKYYKITAPIIAAMALAICVVNITTVYSKPNNAYLKDLNGDKIEEIVVEQKNGVKTVFEGQKDGTYKKLEVGKGDSIDQLLRGK